jgi:hypothetical protein
MLGAEMGMYRFCLWLCRLFPIVLLLLWVPEVGDRRELLIASVLAFGVACFLHAWVYCGFNGLANRYLIGCYHGERSFENGRQFEKFERRFMRNTRIQSHLCARKGLSFAEVARAIRRDPPVGEPRAYEGASCPYVPGARRPFARMLARLKRHGAEK